MTPLPISPAPEEIRIESLSVDAHGIVIHARARRERVPCPACGRPATRVHSRYRRILADLPWHETAVRLQVQARRFFCDEPDCERRIFAERLDRTTAVYARRTNRLGSALDLLALALGGEAGARVARELRMRTSADTLLRRARAVPDPEAAPVRILGVDDWAWKKRHRYGTILTDLERGRIVDLLPDRTADALAAWLEAHPGVEVIARDRSGAYAEGADRGAPDAVQVADRWHLVRNLTDAIERALVGRSTLLGQATGALAPASPPPPPEECAEPPPRPPTRAERAKAHRREARLRRYEEVVRLRRSGMSKKAIARTTGLSRGTVTSWLAAGGFPERKERSSVGSILDPYRAYIERRFHEGYRNAAQLHREIRAQGFAGSRTPVRDFVRQLREGFPTPPAIRFRRPSVRTCAWWLVLRDDELSDDQRRYLDALTGLSPEISLVRSLAQEFRRMLAESDLRALGAWVEAARRSPLRTFAQGIHSDVAAVRAAIELPWSNGPTEGHVNRLKTIKRQMYGRAGFDLLRARMLHAA